ncbi:MAG: hypothetical protein OEX02_00590 [Cyclobacteriaceae bacterium]|nr:hypothetical protein [Cyclobacteriaceae bacterium]
MNAEAIKQQFQECCTSGATEKCETRTGRGPSCFYGLGVIGASIYFISQATGFWMGVVGVLKALVWPAFLVFEAFGYLGI